MKKFILTYILCSFAFSSSFENEIATNTKNLYRSLRRGYVNESKVNYTYKLIKKSDVFSHYTQDFALLKKTASISFLKETTCKIDSDIKNRVHNSIRKSVVNYCHSIKIAKLAKRKKFKLDAIKNSISHLNKFNPSLLNRTLNRIKKYSKNYLTISRHLTFLSANIELSEYLLDHYDTSESETNNRSKPSAYRELRKLYYDFKPAIKEQPLKGISKAKELMDFYEKNKATFENNDAGKYLIYAGTIIQRAGFKNESLKYYEKAYALISKKNLKDEAKFKILWNHIKYDKFKESLKTVEKYKIIENFSQQSSKVKFWTAYLLKKSGEDSISSHLFDQIIKADPLSYYSILSKREYANYDLSVYSDKDQIFSHIEVSEKNFSQNFLDNIEEAKVWANLTYHPFASRLLSEIAKTNAKDVIINKHVLKDFDDNDLNKVLAVSMLNEFKKETDFLSSFRLLNSYLSNHIMKINEFDLKYIFPQRYLNIISKYSGEVDPLFILSLIRQESAFDHDIVSHANARGLMQLLPQTARALGKIKSNNDLFKPEINIKLGSKYLNELMNKFDGNLIYTLSAYNAGPTKTRSWIRDIFDETDPLKLIEEIPYKETRMYVKLIYRNLYFYQFLYQKRRTPQSLEKSFILTKNVKN